MNARENLIALYLDFVNNFLTVAKFAEHHGLTETHAERLVNLGRAVFATPHPER